MNIARSFRPAAIAVTLLVGFGFTAAANAQSGSAGGSDWTPAILPDGQPDIQGIWNNVDAQATPMELPDGFSGPDFTPEDLQAIAEARAARRAPGAWARTARTGSTRTGTRWRANPRPH